MLTRPTPTTARLGALLLLALAFAVPPAAAQTVCDDSYTLETQSEVDDFADLECTEVTGNLSIETAFGTSDPITSLAGLDALTSVGGILRIRYNDALTSLEGLGALASVGSLLSIFGNDTLTSFEGLGALTSVGGGFVIDRNNALTSLAGLDALASIGGTLFIVYSDALTSLEGLGALTSVGSGLEISTNAALTSLEGLGAITSLGGDLEISINAALTSLEGLSTLADVAGTLNIQSNASLTSLDGLGALTSVGVRLFIIDNAALTSLDGLGALTSVGLLLRITNNASLTEGECALAGLVSTDPEPAFSRVDGDVLVSDNPAPFTSPEALLDAIATGCFNQPPTAAADVYATNEGTPLVVAAPGVLGNDTDPDDDALTVTAFDATSAQGGTVVVNADGSFTYTPLADFYGEDTFTYTASDGTATSTATVTVAVNAAPSAEAGEPRTVLAGQTVTLDASASSDPDDAFDDLAFAWNLDGPGYDDAELSGAMPTFCAAEPGTYTATLTVTDPDDASDSDEVIVTALSNAEALDALDAEVRALAAEGVLNRGLVRALTRKLDQAGRLLRRGKTKGALGVLGGYEQQLADLVAEGVLTDDQAATLSAAALSTAIADPCTAEEAGAQTAEGPDAAATTGAPEAFALEAAYPNPLRSSATVGFALPEAADVRLVAYDALGREVAVLVDRSVEAGRHTAVFNASGLPTGAYLVRLTTDGGFSAAQRITVVR